MISVLPKIHRLGVLKSNVSYTWFSLHGFVTTNKLGSNDSAYLDCITSGLPPTAFRPEFPGRYLGTWYPSEVIKRPPYEKSRNLTQYRRNQQI